MPRPHPCTAGHLHCTADGTLRRVPGAHSLLALRALVVVEVALVVALGALACLDYFHALAFLSGAAGGSGSQVDRSQGDHRVIRVYDGSQGDHRVIRVSTAWLMTALK